MGRSTFITYKKTSNTPKSVSNILYAEEQLHLLYTRVLKDEIPEERKMGMEAGFALGDLCDERWFYIDRGMSPGMKMAWDRAKERGQIMKKISLHDKLDLDKLMQLYYSGEMTTVAIYNDFGDASGLEISLTGGVSTRVSFCWYFLAKQPHGRAVVWSLRQVEKDKSNGKILMKELSKAPDVCGKVQFVDMIIKVEESTRSRLIREGGDAEDTLMGDVAVPIPVQ